jgi:hypothetical protein
MTDKALIRAARKKVHDARRADGKTIVTCPASRHAQMIGEYLGTRRPYAMLQEEPEHCAESILSTVASVYRLRLRVYNLEAALVRAREGFISARATGQPILPEWNDKTLQIIDAALAVSSAGNAGVTVPAGEVFSPNTPMEPNL